MLLRDLAVRTVQFNAEPSRSSTGDRTEYFRIYNERRAQDPVLREQWRAASKRYRQRAKTTK
jgi:hypothetical protein